MRIAINLASRPFADIGPAIKRLRIAMGVLAVLALVLGIGRQHLHHKAEVARARDHSLDGSIARINQERQGYQTMMQEPKNAQVLDESAALNRLFDEKAFSWTLAMEDLETVLPAGIQVTTLEPNRSPDGVITLKLRVAGPRDRAIELVQNLEHSRHFSSPRIVGESAEATGGPNERVQPVSASNRVSFDVLADYVPPPDVNRATSGKKRSSPTAGSKPSDTAGGSASSGKQALQSGRKQAGGQRTTYLGMPRPKAPVQIHKGVAQ